MTRVIFQCGILTHLHIFYPWNSDSKRFQGAEYIQSFKISFQSRYIRMLHYIIIYCQLFNLKGVKIQQRAQNSTAKEGHNSTTNLLNIDPGSIFTGGGVQILSYTGNIC